MSEREIVERAERDKIKEGSDVVSYRCLCRHQMGSRPCFVVLVHQHVSGCCNVWGGALMTGYLISDNKKVTKNENTSTLPLR